MTTPFSLPLSGTTVEVTGSEICQLMFASTLGYLLTCIKDIDSIRITAYSYCKMNLRSLS